MQHDEDPIDRESGWAEVLNKGVRPFVEMVEGNNIQLEAKQFILIYDKIFKMCIQREPYNWSQYLYTRYSESVSNYLGDNVANALSEVTLTGVHERAMLKVWNERWHNHKLVVKGMQQMFMYLDRFYTRTTEGVRPLREEGFALYKTVVFDRFSAQAIAGILKCIERERHDEEEDRGMLREAVQVFVEIGFFVGDRRLEVYCNSLETKIVSAAGNFFSLKSREWLDQDSCSTYLKKAEKVLAQEKLRVQAYLIEKTEEPLLREVHDRLLRQHQAELLEKKTGVDYMLSENRVDDLRLVYHLYKKYPKDLLVVGDQVQKHIKRVGMELVAEAQRTGTTNDPVTGLVAKLITMHAQFADVVKECFADSTLFQKALKQSFEDVINEDNRVSHMLADYVHEVLRKNSKINVNNVDKTLNQVVFLYGYIRDKDIFERYYQTWLAQRLLHGVTKSEHDEKSMIGKLKQTSGYQWTNKLEGMFKDITQSKDLVYKFNEKEKSFMANNQPVLDVKVCTVSYWPKLNDKEKGGKIPDTLVPLTDKFKDFYTSQYTSMHVLDFMLKEGQAEVSVAFKQKYTLVVTTYQMMILLLFNSPKKGGVLSFKDIMDRTGCSHRQISHHLMSLCHPKIKVLDKKPGNNECNENHMFRINGNYKNNLRKVTIPLMKPAKVTDEEKSEEDKLQTLRRQHILDSAIVRIMKNRKVMRHMQLTSEVIEQVQARFKPTSSDIKKRIESLIAQEYLERDENERSQYKYLA